MSDDNESGEESMPELGEEEYTIDYIVDSRFHTYKGETVLEYLIHWKDYGVEDRSWTLADQLDDDDPPVVAFYKKHPFKPRKGQRTVFEALRPQRAAAKKAPEPKAAPKPKATPKPASKPASKRARTESSDEDDEPEVVEKPKSTKAAPKSRSKSKSQSDDDDDGDFVASGDEKSDEDFKSDAEESASEPESDEEDGEFPKRVAWENWLTGQNQRRRRPKRRRRAVERSSPEVGVRTRSLRRRSLLSACKCQSAPLYMADGTETVSKCLSPRDTRVTART